MDSESRKLPRITLADRLTEAERRRFALAFFDALPSSIPDDEEDYDEAMAEAMAVLTSGGIEQKGSAE